MVSQHDCTNVCKALTSQCCPDALRLMLKMRFDVSARVTRSIEAGDLHLPKFSLAQTSKCFSHRVLLRWKALSPSVRSATSKSEFVAAF